jgi:hypothetical protein
VTDQHRRVAGPDGAAAHPDHHSVRAAAARGDEVTARVARCSPGSEDDGI